MRLSVGEHLLRVRAVDPAGRVSRLRVLRIVVEPAPTPAPVLAKISLPDSGFMTAGAGSLWVNRFGPSGAIYRIDPATNSLSATIQVTPAGEATGGGNDISFGFGSIWEVDSGGDSVSRIDPATNTVTAVISVRTGSLPEGLAITPNAVWVAEHEPVGTILKIDPTTNTIVDQIHIGGVPSGGPAYIVSAAGSVWGNGPGAVSRINPITDTVQTARGTCAGHGGFKMATDGISALWATNCGIGISRIDTATNTIRTVLPGQALAPYNGGTLSNLFPEYGGGIFPEYGGGVLWILGSCNSSDCLWAINPITNQINKAWTLPFPAGDAAVHYYAYNSLWISSGTTLLRLNPTG